MTRSDSSVAHVVGGQSLLKTKNEDQGFEIIKEVPPAMPRMGNLPFFGPTSGIQGNSNLSSLAALMSGGSMSNMSNLSSLLTGAAGGVGGMGSLMSQSNMLQKCKSLGSHEK